MRVDRLFPYTLIGTAEGRDRSEINRWRLISMQAAPRRPGLAAPGKSQDPHQHPTCRAVRATLVCSASFVCCPQQQQLIPLVPILPSLGRARGRAPLAIPQANRARRAMFVCLE